MMRDVERELIAALRRVAPDGRISQMRGRPWASATFTGAQHAVALVLPTGAALAFAAGIDDVDFALRDHFVASVAVVAFEPAGNVATVRIEVLTIEEAGAGNEAAEDHVAAA